MKWNPYSADLGDGIETAATAFGAPQIKFVGAFTLTPEQFDKMGVGNHRARLGMKTPRDAFPESDSPRGGKCDVDAVTYFMTTTDLIDPIMILCKDDKLVVIDGVHRLVAAYITGSIISLHLYE